MIVQVNSESKPVHAVFALALPVLMEQFLSVLVGVVDVWLTGNFLPGEAYLAAIGLLAYILWLLPNLFSCVGIGATALIARFVGANDQRSANRVANQAILLGSMMAVAITAVAWTCGDSFIRQMQLQGEAGAYAVRYLKILVPVIPAMMIMRVVIACLRGAGDTMTGLAVMTLVNVINVVLSVGLAIGVAGLPNLGWDGIAYGTAVSQVVGAMILLVVLCSGRGAISLDWRSFRIGTDLSKRLLRIGIPGGFDTVAIISCHLWFVTIINALGNDQAAAHGLAIRIESLAYLPGTAFSVAAMTLTGQYLGAKSEPSANRSIVVAGFAGGGIMVLAGIVFFFFGQHLAGFFTANANPNTIASTARLLKIAAFSMPSLAITMVVTGGLRGAGDTRWPMLINMLGIIGVRIPLAYLLTGTIPLGSFTCEMGLAGAWYAMFIDIVFRSILISWRFHQGGWKKIKV